MTVFGSTELVARIERAECAMLAEGVARAAGGFAIELAGGIASWGGASSPLNKVAGLGFAGPLDPVALDAVEAAFAARDTPVQVELATLADPAIAPMLTARGYALVGFENVLVRRLPIDAPVPPPGITVEPSPLAELQTWIDVIVTGFAHADTDGVPTHEHFPRETLTRVLRETASGPHHRRYLARRDGAVAGAGGLRLADGIAQLAGAATLPAHRRRGVQTALLAARLADAGAAGGELAAITTLPGSKSQSNAQRDGFALVYTRAILVR